MMKADRSVTECSRSDSSTVSINGLAGHVIIAYSRAKHFVLVLITPLLALKMERDDRLGHRQKQRLLCVLPRRERQSVVPSGAPDHTGLRAHGTRREPTFDGGRPVAV